LSPPVSGAPRAAYRGQGGLLDVEIDPNFAGNGLDARLIPDPRLGLFDLSTKTKKRRGGASKALIRLTLDGNRVTNMDKRIRGVAQAPDGAVLLLVDGDYGELLRLTLGPVTTCHK
jgi:glucose/arabinose dehydrogenase